MNYLFKNGRYMNEEGKIVATDLLVQDGKIAKVAENITADNAEVIDVNGKLIAPGLVDVHVHLREPGGEHKETIETGTLAAAKVDSLQFVQCQIHAQYQIAENIWKTCKIVLKKKHMLTYYHMEQLQYVKRVLK